MFPLIDGLQYANWSPQIFAEMKRGNVHGVHATICYHENFRETIFEIEKWNRWFELHPDLIFHGSSAADVDLARSTNRTAVFFGSQNPSCIEDDIGLVEVLHSLGLRFMQLTYNNQSLLASGCYEKVDGGLTRMGREVVLEMNRVGLVIDMSHSSERSTLEAISYSRRPIAITHANPASWHPVPRNKSDDVLRALADSGGILGFSLYPHHLLDGSDCTLQSFCEMVARTAEMIGVDSLAIGSDLCQGQPDSVVEWMRNGRWTKNVAAACDEPPIKKVADASAVFPPQPKWFASNLDFANIAAGLVEVGMVESEVAKIMGGNWYDFFAKNFVSENYANN